MRNFIFGIILTFTAIGALAQSKTYGPAKTHTYRLHHEKCTLKYQTWVSGVEYNGKYKCFIRVTNVGKTTIKNLYLTIDPSETSLTETCRLIGELPPGQMLSTWVLGTFEPGSQLPLTVLNFEGEPDMEVNLPKEQIEQEKKQFHSEFEKIIFLSDEKESGGGNSGENTSSSDKVINTVKKIIRDAVTDPNAPRPVRKPVGGIRG